MLIVGAVLVLVLLLSLRGIARFYTDFLWYDSLDQSGVWRGVLVAKGVLAVLFIALFFLLAWAKLLGGGRLAPLGGGGETRRGARPPLPPRARGARLPQPPEPYGRVMISSQWPLGSDQ